MTNLRSQNIFGALALAVSDEILNTVHDGVPDNFSPAGLALIGHVPGISIEELSHGLNLSHAGTVRLIDRMATGGLVERRPSPSDGRAVELHLTRPGREIEQKILAGRRNILRGVFSQLDKEEQQALARISEKLLGKMVRNEAHALSVCRLCDAYSCRNCPVDSELERLEAQDYPTAPTSRDTHISKL